MNARATSFLTRATETSTSQSRTDTESPENSLDRHRDMLEHRLP